MKKRTIVSILLIFSLFFGINQNLSAQVLEQDSLALVALYDSTGGANWTENTNWLTGPVSTWYGITVSGGCVIEVRLDNNNLVGTIPSVIGELISLNILKLSNNQLTDVIPQELYGLTNLTYLYLSGNQFSGSIKTDIGNLVNLASLILEKNQLEGQIPAEIGNLTKLEYLSLGSNRFTGSIPISIGNLKNLKSLSIRFNQLIDTIPSEIGNMINLTFLSLSENQLTGTIPSEIGNLTKLTCLDLKGNELTGSIPPEIGNLTNLTGLFLYHNHQLTGPIPPEIGNLIKLTNLTLRNNEHTGKIPPQIGNLTNLTSLDLDDNDLTGPIPPEIGNLTNLTELDLSFNQLSDAIPPEISNLTNLTELYLSHNQLSDSIPPAIVNLVNLRILDLSNNYFIYLPDLSSITTLQELKIQNNKFTFDDIEPNLVFPTFVYSPQDTVETLLEGTIAKDSTITISVSVGGSYNQYQWFRDEKLIEGAADTIYTIDSLSIWKTGTYYCEITNSAATELILYNQPITVSFGYTWPQLDSLALVALYDSTHGTNWIDNTNWLTGPLSTWHGISVSNGRVSRISMYNNNLVGTIPEDIHFLTKLQNLSLNNKYNYPDSTKNQLTGPVPSGIERLIELNYLDLSGNQLTDSLPPGIGNLTELTYLLLSNNQLSGVIPLQINNLSNLIYLNLSNNRLSGSIQPEIGNLTNLVMLYLNGNNLSGTIPSEIGNLTTLQILQLYDNQLEGSLPSSICNLINLSYLSIYKNQFTDLPDLSSMTKMTYLAIRNNRFTFEDIEPNVGIQTFRYAPQDSLGEAQDTTLESGSSLKLSVIVGGTANLYQWIKDSVFVSDADSSVYTIDSVDTSDAGSYVCMITNTIAPLCTLYTRPVNVSVPGGTGIEDNISEIPKEFRLFQNYPNPFNSTTLIKYDLPEESRVVLKIYNIRGKEIRTIVNDFQSAGERSVLWDGLNEHGIKVSSGIYIYRIETGSHSKSRKMIMVK